MLTSAFVPPTPLSSHLSSIHSLTKSKPALPQCSLIHPYRTARMQLSSPSIKVGRPKTSIKKNVGNINEQTSQPEADTERGSSKARPRRKTQADEVPMYKVILLGDDEYDEVHVVTQLQKIVQLEKKEAQKIYQEAQSTGSSIVCVVCEEHAEFYAQQLRRQEIFVEIEKDE